QRAGPTGSALPFNRYGITARVGTACMTPANSRLLPAFGLAITQLMETKHLPLLSALLALGLFTLLSVGSFAAENADKIPAEHGDIQITPINHATFAMEWDGKWILVDPVGGEQKIRAKVTGSPDL